MNAPVAVTDRLVLRDFTPSDVPLYVALSADPEIMRYLGGPKSAEHCIGEIEAISKQYAAIAVGMLAVERREDGQFLGICGLSYEPWYPDDLQIGWRFFKDHWGQGYPTEAARVWRDHAFATLGAPRLISISDVPNFRSHRVMERLGMRPDHDAVLQDGEETFEARIYVQERALWQSVINAGNFPR
ncbi:MAG: N-acetyltransferase [Hyphomicrobiales bacterium]|nr:MAG: N-acetyltransferase [Hyphomicrobiales bacterium]